MVFALIFRWASLICAVGFAGEPLDTDLKKIARLESEKVSEGSVVSPKLLVSGKPFKRNLIAFRSKESVSISIPIDQNSATLRQVFLNLENGGIYLVDPNHPEAVKAKSQTRYLQMASSDKAEPAFLKQFAHLLQQRHPKDPSTAKFFKFYFGVEQSDESLAEIKFPFAEGENFQNTALESLSLMPQEQPVDLERLFDLMANPQDWTGLECSPVPGSTGKRCRYEHAKLGQMVLAHPGPADVLFEESELFDPKDLLPVEAPVVASRPELEKVLAEQPPEVTTALVLVTHEDCGPCTALKRPTGLWGELCQRLRRKHVEGVAAFAEVVDTPNFAPSPLMAEYALPRGYPQLLVFRRAGSGWSSPQRYSAAELQEQLRLQQKK